MANRQDGHDGVDRKRDHQQAELVRAFARHATDGSTTEAVHSALVDCIDGGLLPAGTRLGEEYLASIFSVSRTPIREALMQLEAEYLAERDGRGLVVARISVEQIIEIYVVREVLDGAAARLAATQARVLDLRELEGLNQQLRALAESGRFDEMADVNVHFHDVIARASQNEMLERFIAQVHGIVRRFRTTTFSSPGRALEAVNEHEAVLGAIRARDPEEAERIARSHMHEAMAVRIDLEIQARAPRPVA